MGDLKEPLTNMTVNFYTDLTEALNYANTIHCYICLLTNEPARMEQPKQSSSVLVLDHFVFYLNRIQSEQAVNEVDSLWLAGALHTPVRLKLL